MTQASSCQIYLQTPMVTQAAQFLELLPPVLDAVPIACLRLVTPTTGEDDIRLMADLARDIAHERDIAVLIDTHYRLVSPLGLDGVHLLDGHKNLREVRKFLGAQATIGCYCGTSRHGGMTAAEMTGDYVAFGPVAAALLLGDGSVATPDLFRWWSEMIEVPVVAEGQISLHAARSLAAVADFICLGEEVWSHPDGPVNALRAFADCLN